jgi:imidazolonepropionase-like amidohydrolase
MALDAGVTLLAGTDTGAPYRLPGWATQEELALMVAAGLSPLEALQTATINPARSLNMTGMLGSVEPGKLADLLLLDGDPLIDINNATRIAAVIVDGRLFDRASVQQLLDYVAAAANP